VLCVIEMCQKKLPNIEIFSIIIERFQILSFMLQYDTLILVLALLDEIMH